MGALIARLRPSRNQTMFVRYEEELRLFKTRHMKLAMLVLVAVWFVVPRILSDFWLLVANYAGVAAIGAIGLNVLTGYTGQVSLGHAFFISVGAYVAGNLGLDSDVPFILWLPACFVAGALIGAVIGPFALRLRGDYLAIITLGLVFVGGHLWDNWDTVTGGGNGVSTAAPVELFGLDFADLTIGGESYSRNQGLFWLIWAIVAIVAILVKNIVRTRPGRALQAVRDRDVAAEVIGVSLARYKIAAFSLSSGLAALAGGLYGSLQQYVAPNEWTLVLSITYIAMIIVGGMATVFGSILGAIVVTAIPRLIERYSAEEGFFNSLIDPLVQLGPGDGGIISVFSLNVVIFGLLIVVFLLVEPRGLAALWLRIKAYFKAWPFSY